jgi:hypothetical protein
MGYFAETKGKLQIASYGSMVLWGRLTPGGGDLRVLQLDKCVRVDLSRRICPGHASSLVDHRGLAHPIASVQWLETGGSLT